MKRPIYHWLHGFAVFFLFFFLHKVNMAEPEPTSAVWFSSLGTCVCVCVFIHAKGVWQAAEYTELPTQAVLWLRDVESAILTGNG